MITEESFIPEYGLIKLDEVKLNRITLYHMKNGFIIITANRSCEAEKGSGNCTENEIIAQNKKNIENNKQIKKDITRSGFSFIQTYGGFKEKIIDKTTEKEDYKDVLEPSYIVPSNRNKMTSKINIDVNGVKLLGIDLSKKYNQDVFMFGDGNKFYFVDKDGKTEQELSNVKLNDITQIYYTKLFKSRRRADRRFTIFEIFGRQSPGSLSESLSRYGETFIKY